MLAISTFTSINFLINHEHNPRNIFIYDSILQDPPKRVHMHDGP